MPTIAHESARAGPAAPPPAPRPRRSWLGPLLAVSVFLLNTVLFLNHGAPVGDSPPAWRHLPLDDAWIHLSYAKNLLRWGYFAYNRGQVETGATSPLWVLLLAAALALLRHPVLTAKLMSLLAGAAAVAMTYRVLRRLGGAPAAWTAALLLALDPLWIVAAASGMEVTLTGLLLILFVDQVDRRRPARAGLLAGLLILARPEMSSAGLAGAGLILCAIWRETVPGDRPRRLLTAALRWTVPAVACALPWLLYCRLGTGRWLPNTFYVKVERVSLDWEKFKVFYDLLEHGYWPSAFMHDPTGLALMAVAIVFAVRDGRRRLGALALALLPLAHIVGWTLVSPNADNDAHPGQYLTFFFDRYYLPDYALLFGLAGMGAAALGHGLVALGRRLRTDLAPPADRLLRRALAAAPVLMLAAGNLLGWWTYVGPLWLLGDGSLVKWRQLSLRNQQDCRSIHEIHETVGRWVARNIPPDEPLAIQDAGAIRYFTENPVIDLGGLNSHAFFFSRDKEAWLRRHNVRLALIFCNGRMDPLFHFTTRTLHRFTFHGRTISEGDVMDLRELVY